LLFNYLLDIFSQKVAISPQSGRTAGQAGHSCVRTNDVPLILTTSVFSAKQKQLFGENDET
jgi:hypothetical protein